MQLIEVNQVNLEDSPCIWPCGVELIIDFDKTCFGRVVLTRLTILTWLKLLREVLFSSLMGTIRAHLFTAGNEPLKKNLMQKRTILGLMSLSKKEVMGPST